MNPVIQALKFRHACKKFDPQKKISQSDVETILAAAHLSPTSFGLEAWKILIIKSDDVKKRLRPACWDQAQVTDSSHVLVILAKPCLASPDSDYIIKNLKRRQLPADMTAAYISRYKEYMETEVFPKMSAYAWCSKQCYIVLANIMTAAASLSIDSCPMEGFEKVAVEKVLKVNTDEYEVAVLVALGYRADAQTPRHRNSFERFFEYR